MKKTPGHDKSPRKQYRTNQLRPREKINSCGAGDVCHGHPYCPGHAAFEMKKWRCHFVQMALAESMIQVPGMMSLVQYIRHLASGNLNFPGTLCCRISPVWIHNCLMEQLNC